MARKTGTSLNTARNDAHSRDYTQIDIADDGKVVVEFNVWDGSLKQYISTALRLVPEEARLLAEMLRHNAGSAVGTGTGMAIASNR